MATSAQVAEGISDLDIDFDDAETLHQVLLHLHEITEAVQGRLNSLADRVAETGLKEKYSDAIKEAASAQSGVGEQLKDVVGGGVLQG